jgi:polysaccharide biosynthesis protein PslH
MKILQLTKKFPYPLNDGEVIAITSLARALNTLGSEVSLLSMNTTRHFFEEKSIPDDFNHYHSVDVITVDNRLKVLDAFLNLFSSQSYHISRFISKKFENKLIELLRNNSFDIIQLETLYLAPYVDTIRKYSSAKIVMRSHNVEHEIWKRITDNTAISAKKMYLQLLSKRLENFELQYLNKYDMMVAITQRDLDFFKKLGCSIPAHVSPIGLKLSDYPSVDIQSENPSFCFIGSLDWMPNIEGVKWILDKVWPLVVKKTPGARFHIAGKNAPDFLLNGKWKNVFVHGEVPSAVDFINAHNVMLVPLFSGSGMRVKILEGMALGRVVLSTQLGLEGIHAQKGKNVLIADEAEDFANQIINCYNNPELISKIGLDAVGFVHQNYDNVAIAEQLINFYKELCKQDGTLNIASVPRS